MRVTTHGSFVFVVIALVLLLIPAQSMASGWRWSRASVAFVRDNQIMTKAVLAKGASAQMTRREWVRSLVALDAYRHRTYGTTRLYSTSVQGARLDDVPADSIYARAVTLGWIAPIGRSFKGSRAITADEASRGSVAAIGLKRSARAFARQLRANLPGLRARLGLRASQSYARVFRMRYNHPVGSEELEVAPGEAMAIGHAAYMLHHAARTSAGASGSVSSYETFDIPDLGTNQRTVIYAAVALVGQPYVWGGETEKMQPEGHGGFDCSGFVWRVVANSGVPAADRRDLNGRSSMAMSDVPRASRIYRVANLRPADLLFWGDRGPKSTPAENFHTGVYLGRGWFAHSSGSNDGVTISHLDGYWRDTFSWGRRVLRTR